MRNLVTGAFFMRDEILIQRSKQKLSHLVVLLSNAVGLPEEGGAYANELPERLEECPEPQPRVLCSI